MINVMYHYVRPDNKEYPYFNHLNLDIFERQLDFFEKKYGFISKNEYMNAIKSGTNIKGVVLSFDDGFKDHYKNVMNILEERGLWALFYISTSVYSSKKLLGVHRIHYLNGKYGARRILKECEPFIENFMLDEENIKEYDTQIYTYFNYDKESKYLRRLFNYLIKYEYRDIVLDNLMNKLFDEDILFNEVYLTKDEIKQLHQKGNIIGSHSETHKVLSRLSFDEQYDEIKNSFDYLNNIIPLDYKSFCYPYGYSTSYNKDTLEILKMLNIDDAVLFDNKVQLDEIKKYELSRIDCNNFMDV